MIMDNIWLEKAASRYEICNHKTLNWILSRSPLIEGFLDTKVNSITAILEREDQNLYMAGYKEED